MNELLKSPAMLDAPEVEKNNDADTSPPKIFIEFLSPTELRDYKPPHDMISCRRFTYYSRHGFCHWWLPRRR